MSTLEAAISMSVILVFLTFLITGPETLAIDTFEEAIDGANETRYYLDDDGLMDSSVMDGINVYNTSAEKLNTYLTGISDNYRLVYGIFADTEE
ncbi:MAG: hypothetical protein K5745_03435 [Saccharofermentans sp.]|nr:hypothetical protein [Saccharofermentans sp.]